jgi:AraC-like DNA-binding protein
LTPGVCILVPPGLSHAEHATEHLDTIWIALRGSRCEGIDSSHVLVAEDRALWRPAEALWIRGARRHGLIGPELDGLSAVLFAAFMGAYRDSEESSDGKDGIDAAVEYMQRNFARTLSVGALAHRFGYSDGHFHRCFKSRTGQTPAQFITRARIGHAMHALAVSTQSVAQIASHCGFSDPQYFSRAFKKVTGMSPLAARRSG